MSQRSPTTVLHKNVSVIACDSSVTLDETMLLLGKLDVDLVQVGERHIVLPAHALDVILSRFKENGHFPRLIGERMEEGDVDEESDEADVEEDA